RRIWANNVSHEDLFIERYEQILRWSLHITGRDAHLAEDLVHDVFVQFTLAQPDLSRVANVEGYLYSMLRNRHLSHIRRAARTPTDRLSAIDYDSAEISLRSTDLRSQIDARDQLRAICRYACLRKESSKAGSVLILRFFRGYYPVEIARLIRRSRQAADTW